MGTIQDMINRFKKLESELQNLSGKTVSIIPDKKGMIDRQCPKDDCKSHFKVNMDDWKNLFRDEEVFCPFCRNNSKASEYMPVGQRQEIKNNIQRAINSTIKYGHTISQNLGSIKTNAEFELNIQCEKCNARYSVIGAAYFCPCCGYNSIEKTAKESIEKIILKAEKVTVIQNALEQTLTKDEAAIAAKFIIESSLSACIGTLQNFSETKYNHLSNSNAPFNAFQNVEKSNKLWKSLNGQGYESWISNDEINKLIIFTQRRHLLEHKGGLVDSKYLQETNDNNYVAGDRIIVKPHDITVLGKIVLKIIDNINKL